MKELLTRLTRGASYKSKPYKMGLQISRSFHSKVQKKKNHLPAVTQASWRGISEFGATNGERTRNFVGQREYIRNQEKEDERLDQLNLRR